ncbi:TetR/AcrR family transcriptional regulator [Actinoplanes sp. NBRC 103695]|uniref:TetR/AcrR family transcriptional regulator n=1 Tax=Actinoplanes sp. NBRC 103695 TaxID=3032202 RepID=UPI0024A355F2|nr:TetR/AcrR family transcriptional regulator [Actinoplanes sp. NBRC 103695]GLY93159.1 TetR family transcriptional regulator [Actinoplanes sp. NBRC 103695]
MTSTRTRPAKPPLSRASIVAAALTLVDETGYAATTMRRVAQAVDTGPASLYVYVADREELMAEVYDLALADVTLPDEGDGDWRARIKLLAGRVIATLGSHDDLALVAITRVRTGRHALRIMEETLRLLRAGGISDAVCPWAADLIDQHITSSALERAARARAGGTREAVGAELDAVFEALPAGAYPTIHALRPSMTTTGDLAAQATWKLRVLIDGLLVAPGGA